MARRDATQLILNHLQDDFDGSAMEQSRTARSLRKDCRTTPTNLLDTKGKLIARRPRAETFVDYLANQVWKAPPKEYPSSPSFDCLSHAVHPFTVEELNIVLCALKKDPGPGLHKIPAELFQGVPYVTLRLSSLPVGPLLPTASTAEKLPLVG